MLLAIGNAFGSGNVGMAVAPLWYTCCIVDGTGARQDGWDVGVLPTGLTGVITSPLQADVLAISASSTHPDEAFAVLRYLLNDERPAALWAVAPAATANRADWYARVDSLYPGVTNWSAADAMLAFPDVPSHQSDMPNAFAAQARLVTFRELLLSDAGAATGHRRGSRPAGGGPDRHLPAIGPMPGGG